MKLNVTARRVGTTAVLMLILCSEMPGCAARRKAAAQGSGNSGGAVPKLSAREAAKYQDPGAVAVLRERAIAMLEEAVKDKNPQVRANAIEALSESPMHLEAIVPLAVADSNVGVRSTVAMMVGKVKLTSRIASMRLLVSDPSPFVRASAIFALSRCGEPVDISPLAELLLNDSSPRVRSHVAYLLGELGEASATPLLREATRARLPKASPIEMNLMQLQLAEAMVKLGDDSQLEVIRAALYPSRPDDLEAAALAVQIIGQVNDKRAMDQLIYLTAYKDNKEGQMPAEIRLGAALSLAKLGNDRGGFIADEYAASPNPALRAQAAFVYGQTGRTENLPRLERLMADSDPVTRVSAAAGALHAGTAISRHLGQR